MFYFHPNIFAIFVLFPDGCIHLIQTLSSSFFKIFIDKQRTNEYIDAITETGYQITI